ncbi:Serine/arginine repetitive matrix protein 2 [Rhodotorula toruloides]|nr:Serine/arginine repetitive matrix protein 2 [Rhodotorula toruloides]
MPVTRTFTLVACDGQRFQIDPALLVKHSSIFADMLSTVHEISPDAEQERALTEDAETVAAFVEALTDKREPDTSGAWIALYRMVDKYDCPELLPMLQLGGWWCCQTDPYLAYSVGILMRDPQLAWAASRYCRKYGPKFGQPIKPGPAFEALPAVAQTLLLDHLAYKAAIVCHILSWLKLDPSNLYTCHKRGCGASNLCQSLTSRILKLQPDDVDQLRVLLGEAEAEKQMCRHCWYHVGLTVDKVEEIWKKP